MKPFKILSALVLFMMLAGAVPIIAQDQENKSVQEAQPATKPEADRPAQEQRPEPQPEQPQVKQEQKQDKSEQQDQKQEQKQEQKEEKHAQNEQQKDQNNQSEKMKAEPVRQAGRIPDDQFHAHFGKQHRFHIARPVVVDGAPRFEYGGYTFVLVNPWPAGWLYTDAFYIDFIDGVYYLCDPLHPEVMIAVTVLA